MCFFFLEIIPLLRVTWRKENNMWVDVSRKRKEMEKVAFVSLDISCFKKKKSYILYKCFGFNVKDFLSYNYCLSGRSGEITGN